MKELRKGLKFKLGKITVEITKASNSEKSNQGYCECCTPNAKFKLHYSFIQNLLNV